VDPPILVRKEALPLYRKSIAGFVEKIIPDLQGGLISLTLRFLKSQIVLSDLKVTLGPPFVIM
jgi:hypothetical protein